MAAVNQARTDEEINEQLESLSNQRSQRITLSPIFGLAPETLAAIFTHGARDYYHESIEHSIFGLPDWLNVSYVCRLWRDIALNCPTLWAYHFTVSLRWTEEILARSKRALLKISVNFVAKTQSRREESWWTELVERLLNHVERIQEFHLRVPAVVLPSNLSLRAPRLQILELDGCWSDFFEFNVTIDGADVPSLRTLQLACWPLTWHSFNLNGLTALFLYNLSESEQNIAEFIAMLRRMQGLTILHLDNALASARGSLSTGTFNVSSKICLPCLTRLFIGEPLPTVVVLLSWVNIPSITDIGLEFRWNAGFSFDDYAQISPVLAQTFNHSKDLLSPGLTIRSLVISDRDSTFILRGDRNLFAATKGPRLEGYNPPLMIVVSMDRSVMTRKLRNRITSDICCSIPFAHVQTLRVIQPTFFADFWSKILDPLHGLRRLRLEEGFMPDLASLLTLADDEAMEATRRIGDCTRTPFPKFVPALEELELCCIAFAPNHNFPDQMAISKKSLLDALSARAAPHPRLTMIKCKPTSYFWTL